MQVQTLRTTNLLSNSAFERSLYKCNNISFICKKRKILRNSCFPFQTLYRKISSLKTSSTSYFPLMHFPKKWAYPCILLLVFCWTITASTCVDFTDVLLQSRRCCVLNNVVCLCLLGHGKMETRRPKPSQVAKRDYQTLMACV